MKTAAKHFAEYFGCSVEEAKDCNHMTVACMESYAKVFKDRIKQLEKEKWQLVWAFESCLNGINDGWLYDDPALLDKWNKMIAKYLEEQR